MAGWQRSIRRRPCPEDDDRDNADEHRYDDDNEYHKGAVEAITGESDGAVIL